ncbi:MAG: hypothetical protein AB8B72_04535 [Crocinitomicaceae bacterium]
MKTIFFSLAILATLVSCNKEDIESQIIGKYELVELLLDPGDGSGVFESTSISKTLELKSNGDFVSTGDICSVADSNSFTYEGTYSVADTTIYADSCNFDLTFSFNNDELIIYYPCIEACKAKYRKI